MIGISGPCADSLVSNLPLRFQLSNRKEVITDDIIRNE